MTEYLPIVCFIVGVLVGAASVIVGFRLGFKASYEIRSHQEESTDGKALFKSNKDPAEFDLVPEEDKDRRQ